MRISTARAGGAVVVFLGVVLAAVTAAVLLTPSGAGAAASRSASTARTARMGPAAPAPETPSGAQHSAAADPATASPAPVDPDATACASTPAGKSIRVSIGEQRAWLCDSSTLVLATPVTTGADTSDQRTLTGTWQIQGKQMHRWLGGPGYSVQVQWWMPYDGDFGLHDAPWQTMPFGSPGWRTQGSHGCVHLPDAAMATLYAWAPVGTPITIAD